MGGRELHNTYINEGLGEKSMSKSFLVEVTTYFNLTENDVEDLMAIALEGGIGYWACLDNSGSDWDNAPDDEPVSNTAARLLMNGKTITFFDEEDDYRVLELTIDDLIRGIRMFIQQGYDIYNAFSNGIVDLTEIDAERADIIFQLALLDDVVYG